MKYKYIYIYIYILNSNDKDMMNANAYRLNTNIFISIRKAWYSKKNRYIFLRHFSSHNCVGDNCRFSYAGNW